MGLRILLADDNIPLRGFLKGYLEANVDCLVCGEAADGLEAIEQAKTLLPDVIVMDLSMPNMNGLEACWALRDSNTPALVILFTLYESCFASRDYHADGIRAIVSKSEPDLLLKHLTEIVNPA
jgi:DNA-binding NarL/FixJ family response regulator